MTSADLFGGYEERRFENKVGIKLKCSVCLKVLKDPVQCPNEHYFCRSCIQRNLRHNAETCPVCQHPLTEETLTKPPRILTEWLENLMIRCDYENRGCRELIKLNFLIAMSWLWLFTNTMHKHWLYRSDESTRERTTRT